MADQGLPLMALPQQNLFGAAGDDLAHQLASREVAKRKQMLEDIDTQLKIQKGNSEADKIGSDIATASSNRRINEAKAPLDLDKLGAEVTKMADDHAKSLTDQQKQMSLRQAQDEFDTAQKAGDTAGMTRAGGKIVGYGGSLMTKDQADAINAPVYQQQIQEKLRAYAMEKDPDKKMAIGMELANIPGAKGVPTADSTPFQSFGNGGIMDSRTGQPVRESVVPPVAGTDNPQAAFKNYQVVKGEVDKARSQYTANLPRMERLEATIKANTPLADSIVAPELITVMAGGMGSGVRITQAEIASTIGGRNAWQDVESKIRRFQADPSQPFLITPAQRQQMIELIGLVKAKTMAHLQSVQKADDALLNSQSVADQRQIFVNLQKELEGDTSGGDANAPPPGAKVVQWVPDPAHPGKFMKAGGG